MLKPYLAQWHSKRTPRLSQNTHTLQDRKCTFDNSGSMTGNCWSRSRHLSPKLHLAQRRAAHPSLSFITVTWFDITICGRPLRFSSGMLSWPSGIRAYQLYIAVFFIAYSPYTFFKIKIVSFFESPFKTQNFIEDPCSSAILMHMHKAIWPLRPK